MGRRRDGFPFRQHSEIPPPDPALLPALGVDVIIAIGLLRLYQFNAVRWDEQADGWLVGGRITAEVDVPGDDGFLGQDEAGLKGDEEEESEGGESRSFPWTNHWSLQSSHRASRAHSCSLSLAVAA